MKTHVCIHVKAWPLNGRGKVLCMGAGVREREKNSYWKSPEQREKADWTWPGLSAKERIVRGKGKTSCFYVENGRVSGRCEVCVVYQVLGNRELRGLKASMDFDVLMGAVGVYLQRTAHPRGEGNDSFWYTRNLFNNFLRYSVFKRQKFFYRPSWAESRLNFGPSQWTSSLGGAWGTLWT